MRGQVHRLPIQTTMNVYQDNLSYLINFETLNQKLERDILDVGDKMHKTTNAKGDMTYWGMHERYDSFKSLLKIVAGDHLEKYVDLGLVNDGKVQVYCSSMWGAVYKKGDYTKEHAHIGARWSFTYYVKAEEDCTPLVFTWPGVMQIKPKTGDLIIWNGDYKHMVPEQQTDTKRIAIAGNLNFWDETAKPTEVLNA